MSKNTHTPHSWIERTSEKLPWKSRDTRENCVWERIAEVFFLMLCFFFSASPNNIRCLDSTTRDVAQNQTVKESVFPKQHKQQTFHSEFSGERHVSLSLSFHLWYFQFSIFSSARRGEKRRNFLFFSLLSFFFRYMKIYWTRFWLCKALEMTQLWLIISTMDALDSDVCCPRAPTKHMKISGFQIEEFFLLVLYGRGETTFLLWLTFPFFFRVLYFLYNCDFSLKVIE